MDSRTKLSERLEANPTDAEALYGMAVYSLIKDEKEESFSAKSDAEQAFIAAEILDNFCERIVREGIPDLTQGEKVTVKKMVYGYLVMAAQAGSEKAQHKLNNIGVLLFRDGNYRQAFEIISMVAELGLPDAQFHLSLFYEKGAHVSSDPQMAFKWCEKAALQGHAVAMGNLGASYLQGDGVKKNRNLALEWYRKSAAAGNEHAVKILLEIFNEKYVPALAPAPAPALAMAERKVDAPKPASAPATAGNPCGACGFDNAPGAQFCGKCGATLGGATSKPPVPADKPAPAPATAGNPCGACGFDNAPGAQFCGKCGATLGASRPPATPAPSPQPAPKTVAAPAPPVAPKTKPAGQPSGFPAIKLALIVLGAAIVLGGGVYLFRYLGGGSSDGLWPIVMDGKMGYMDKNGKIVIPPQFEERRGAIFFSEGLAAVNLGDVWGYIDTNGRMQITPQFESADAFHGGMARVNLGGRIGFIDTSGKLTIPPIYKEAGRFSDGLAPVESDNQWSVIDSSGKTKISGFAFIGEFTSKLAPASRDGRRFGFIDTDGNWAIEPQFEDARNFADGLAPVKAGKWGYIDSNGKFIVNPIYNDARQFSEGLASVRGSNGWGFIDIEGNPVSRMDYTEASEFSDGLAAVIIKDRQAGFIDKTGRQVIPTIFNDVEPVNFKIPGIKRSTERRNNIIVFHNGLALAGLRVNVGQKQHSSNFYIDTAGKFVSLANIPGDRAERARLEDAVRAKLSETLDTVLAAIDKKLADKDYNGALADAQYAVSTYQNDGRAQAALERVQRAMPPSLDSLLVAISTGIASNDFNNALAEAQRAVELYPDDARAQAALERVQQAMPPTLEALLAAIDKKMAAANYNGALGDAQRAVSLYPDDARTQEALKRAQQAVLNSLLASVEKKIANGDYNGALADAQRAVKIAPGNARAKEALDRIQKIRAVL